MDFSVAAEEALVLVGVFLVEERGVVLVGGSQRTLVAHCLAQAREERVVVEAVAVLLAVVETEVVVTVVDRARRRVSPATRRCGVPRRLGIVCFVRRHRFDVHGRGPAGRRRCDGAGAGAATGATSPCDADHDGPCVGNLDLVDRGSFRGRAGCLAEELELRLDRVVETLAVLLLELLERVDIGRQRVAGPAELGDVRFELALLGLSDAACVLLGFGDEVLRFRLGLGHDLRCAGLRLRDGLVSCLLRQDQGPLDDVGVWSARDRGGRWCNGRRRGRDNGCPGRCRCCSGGLGSLGEPSTQLRVLSLEMLDRRRPLEELVDVVTVITPPGLANLDVAKLLGRDVDAGHGEPC